MPVVSLERAGFLHQETVVRTGFLQFLPQYFFHTVIGSRNEIARSFLRDLQLFDFAEVAQQTAGRFPGGPDHHIDGG
jgi:hypothetical protein